MPLLSSQAPAEDTPEASFPKLAEQTQGPQPSWLDIVGAAGREEFGELGNRLLTGNLSHGEDQPGFNPVDHIPAGGPIPGTSYLHDYGHEFLSAHSPEQIEQTRRFVDAKALDQSTMARGGLPGFAASMAAGATDPLNLAAMALIPEAAPTRLGNMLRLAATNAAITAGQEAIGKLQGEPITGKEAALNISANAVLGGVLGSLAPRASARLTSATHEAIHGAGDADRVLGPAQRSAVEPTIDFDALGTPAAREGEPTLKPSEDALPGEPAYVNPSMESTAGAAAVKKAADDLEIARGGKAYSKTVGVTSPAARVLGRESTKAKDLLTQLANLPGTLNQNYRGVANPNPIERILWGYDGLHVQGMQARRAAYGDYLSRIKEEGGQPLSRRDFMDGISQAMRRGDQSPIPEIAKAAQWTRANIFDPLFERAKALGIAPEEAQLHADSYLTRQYDAVKIRNNFGEWIDTLRRGFIKQGVDSAEATDIAHQASRNVLGSERGTMDWHALDGITPKSGNLKERTLALPDTELEPFLNNDIDHLSHSYLRSMAPEVEMTERFGSRDLKDQFGEIEDEYAQKIEQARAAEDTGRMAALDKERNKNISDLAAIRDRLYGTYGAPKDPGSFFVRAGRLLRSVNALRLLGAATLAHFPDVANVISRYGMGNTFGAMAKLATSLQGIKLSLREAQRMGAAIDMTMNVSASLLGDYGSHSQYAEQRFAGKAARAFTIGTGETPLITAVQAMTSTLAQHEILKVAQRVANGGAMNANLAAKLAASGLDRDMLSRIAQASEPHEMRVNGLRFGMSDRWADQGAAKAFESAVIREAHGVTLRPGVGDTPLFMSSELGKLILQFKSFAFAASRVVGLPLAQGVAHGDIRSIEALTALAAMGTMSYVAKQKAAGQPLETNPTRLALEVADKSNFLGWTGEVIYPALWQAGFKDLSRWSDRDPTETLLGPSAGLVASTWERQFPGRLANLASGGALQANLPFRRSDLHFLRRMAPAQNLWYFRRAVNHTEDALGDLFDLPGKSNEQRELMAATQ